MKLVLRDYQEMAVGDAVAFLQSANPGERKCYAAPTGTGKSVIELAIAARIPGAWIVTPKVEIIAGMLDKLGVEYPKSADGIRFVGTVNRIATPIRLKNALLSNSRTVPKALIFDEGHHDLAASWQDIHTLCGYSPAIAFTATPYRGTPRGSAAFREQWGIPQWICSFRWAKDRGFLTMPDCKILPLVDDDVIEISNGELVASQITSAYKTRLADLVAHCRRYFGEGILWDLPTMFACPSTEIALDLTDRLNADGLLAACVTSDTDHATRQVAFRGCVSRVSALVQVQVVSEGVDLPVRRLIDLSPTLSPVRWVQQFGRITRPGGYSEYVCTNRNLFRHAYALDGCVPVADLVAAQAAFPASDRQSMRVLGLEALGRLKAVELPLRSGLTAMCYAISTVVANEVTEYLAIAHPAREAVLWAARTSQRGDGESTQYGRWTRCDSPEDLAGFRSVDARPVSERQEIWWKRCAGRVGLDASADVNRKAFQALPMLLETGYRL